jgi:hypothetical protein
MKCPTCGAEIPEQAAFCPACGAKAIPPADICSSCGKPLLPGALFCNSCGAPVAKKAEPVAAVCPQCGSAVKPDALFCPACGKRLKEAAIPAQPVYQQPVYQQPVAPVPPPVQPVYQQPVTPPYAPPYMQAAPQSYPPPVYQQAYPLPQNQPYPAPPYGQAVPPRKRHGARNALIVLLVIALAGTGVWFLFGRQLKRLVLGTKSVYTEIESKTMHDDSADLVSDLSDWKNNEIVPLKGGSNITLSVDLAENIPNVDPTLAASLENISIHAKTLFDRSTDAPKIFTQIDLLTGEENLMTLEGFYGDDRLVAGLPGILDKYVTATKDDMASLFSDAGVPVDPTQTSGAMSALSGLVTTGIDFNDKQLQASIDKMVDIMLKHVDKVEFKAGQPLKAGDVTANYDQYSMTISEKSAGAAVTEICEYLKTDDEIFGLAQQIYGIAASSGELAESELTRDAYKEALDNAIADIEKNIDENSKANLVQNVYVDRNDEVVGRELTFTDADGSKTFHFLFANPVSGKKEGLAIVVEADGQTYGVNGSYTVDNNLKTGKLDVQSAGSSVATVTFKNLDTDSPDNDQWLFGELSIDVVDAGESYTGPTSFTYKGWKEGDQKLFSLGSPEYGSIELGYSEVPEKEITFPTYDSSQLVSVKDNAGLQSLMTEDAMNQLTEIINKLGLTPTTPTE